MATSRAIVQRRAAVAAVVVVSHSFFAAPFESEALAQARATTAARRVTSVAIAQHRVAELAHMVVAVCDAPSLVPLRPGSVARSRP